MKLEPATVKAVQRISILLEDDCTVSLDAYTNFLFYLFPSSELVVSSFPEQTLDFCAARIFHFVIIDHKGPALTAATAGLLASLTVKTAVVIISSARRAELDLPAGQTKVCIVEKPIALQSLETVLKERLHT